MANYFRTFVESSIPSWLESLGCLAPADMEFRWPTTTIYTAPLKVVLLCYGCKLTHKVFEANTFSGYTARPL